MVALQRRRDPGRLTAALVVSLLVSPLLLAEAFRRYPRWWISVMLRVRSAVLLGQTEQHRLERTPPGEVVARSMDADRLARYADRWVDLVNGLAIVAVTAIVAQSLLAGGVLLVVMIASALASSLGRRVAGRSAAASASPAPGSAARWSRHWTPCAPSSSPRRRPSVHAHLREVDGGRVDAAVREHRVQALLDGVPIVMVQCGVVAAWALLVSGQWGLATALLVSGAVTGFDWFGRVAGSVITEAPGTRAWMHATSRLAGGGDLMHVPAGVDLVHGRRRLPSPRPRPRCAPWSSSGSPRCTTTARSAPPTSTSPSARRSSCCCSARSARASRACSRPWPGWCPRPGEIRWNGEPVDDPQTFLRPGRVAHVAQVPRVLSGTFADNVRLDHADREVVRTRDRPDGHRRRGGPGRS